MKDQEIDGVDAEILYPTLGMPIFSMHDGDLQRACFHVYNDWVAEYCRYDPKRLYGIGLISLEDIDAAVEDVESIAKQGMRGAMIWGAAPEDRPCSDRAYDPFWQAASEAALPVSLHIIASRGRRTVGVGNKTVGSGSLNAGIWYSTFPDSHGFIERNFAGVPEPVRQRIVYDNAVALYGMEFD